MSILGVLLKAEQEKRGVSDRKISRDTGVSPTTIGRIKQGYRVEGPTLEAVCRWLNIRPSVVVDADAAAAEAELKEKGDASAEDPLSDDSLAQQLRVILAANPQLYDNFTEIVRKIAAGEVSMNLLTEAITFINVRLSMEEQSREFIEKRGGNVTGSRKGA